MSQVAGWFLFLVFLVLIIIPKQDSVTATRALNNLGFKKITITGARWTGCGEEDFYHTGFEAVNAQERRVTGVVCSGLFKSSTVRFD